jgi:hypothetical protein
MPSAYSVYVKTKPLSGVAETKTFYATRARGSIQIIYDAPDALVANRKEPRPAGSYCEVTACTAVAGKTMCVESEGATVDGNKVTKLTSDECLTPFSAKGSSST